jgi:hypothetical protein
VLFFFEYASDLQFDYDDTQMLAPDREYFKDIQHLVTRGQNI